MVKCVFCGKEEHHFKGVNLIKNDGTVNFYCSSKCRKNALNLKRDRRKLKWALAYREERQKEEARSVKMAEKQANLAKEKKK